MTFLRTFVPRPLIPTINSTDMPKSSGAQHRFVIDDEGPVLIHTGTHFTYDDVWAAP